MSKKQILKHVGRIVPDPEVKCFFSRIDHYYSKISHRRKLKDNLFNWKKYCLYSPSCKYHKIFVSCEKVRLPWTENHGDHIALSAYSDFRFVCNGVEGC